MQPSTHTRSTWDSGLNMGLEPAVPTTIGLLILPTQGQVSMGGTLGQEVTESLSQGQCSLTLLTW